jgi:hypothetical protein
MGEIDIAEVHSVDNCRDRQSQERQEWPGDRPPLDPQTVLDEASERQQAQQANENQVVAEHAASRQSDVQAG